MKQTLIPAPQLFKELSDRLESLSNFGDLLLSELPNATRVRTAELRQAMQAKFLSYRSYIDGFAPRYIKSAVRAADLESKMKLRNMGRNNKHAKPINEFKPLLDKLRGSANALEKNYRDLFKVKAKWSSSKKIEVLMRAQIDQDPTYADIMDLRLNGDIKELENFINTKTTRTTKAGRTYEAKPNMSQKEAEVKRIWEAKYGKIKNISVPSRTRPGERRVFEFKYYSELVARSESARVRSENVIKNCRESGIDLVYMPSHQDPCELCRPFEGRIFSISGKDPIYPPLETIGIKMPLHPNCEHSWQPITSIMAEELLRLEPGIGADTVDYSTTIDRRKFEISKKGREEDAESAKRIFIKDPVSGVKVRVFPYQKDIIEKFDDQRARFRQFKAETTGEGLDMIVQTIKAQSPRISIKNLTDQINREITRIWGEQKLPILDKYGHFFGYLNKHYLTVQEVTGLFL